MATKRGTGSRDTSLQRLQQGLIEEATAAGCDHTDLVVEDGDQITLSPTAAGFKTNYHIVRPASADEARKWLGIPEPAAGGSSPCVPCPPQSGFGARVVTPDDLHAEDPAARQTATGVVRAVARAYVMGTPAMAASLSTWKAALDEYFRISDVAISVVLFQDVIVQNHATLGLSLNTHTLMANRIRMFGTGRIVCNGPKTFRAASMEGKLPTFSGPLTTAGNLTATARPKTP